MNLNNFRKWHFAAFLTSLVCALIAFAFAEFWPLGSRSLVSMDMWGQYYPMLRELKTALSENNVLYSWNGGLGFNLVAQIAYYTASPAWLIVCLFPVSFLTAGIHITTLLKIALAGLFFHVFIFNRTKQPSPLSVAFSVGYALSSYFISFINQIMWFDAIVLLPLVALGIEKMCDERRPLIYFVALSLTIISNFYIAFMVCIFSVLWFIVYELTSKRRFSLKLRSALRFGLWSLLSGGAAAATIIPVYCALQNTIASTLGFEGELKLYHSFEEIIRNMMPFGKISLEFGMGNIYCGILPLILAFAYLLCRKIPLKKRIAYFILAAFFILSFDLNLLDFIWHGFHYPNQLPCRQSFIYILLILTMGYEAARANKSDYAGKAAIASTIPLALAITALFTSKNAMVRPFAFGIAIIIIIFLLAVVAKRAGKKAKFIICERILPLLLTAEVTASAAFMLTTQTFASHYDDITYFDKTMECINLSYESKSDDFYRSEWFPLYHFNPGQMYDFKGVTFYSSMMTAGTYDFFRNAGCVIYAKNVSTRYVQTPVLNSMLGIRYVYDRDGNNSQTGLTTVDTINEKFTVRENQYRLPVAFMCSESLKDFSSSDDAHTDPIDFQNDLFMSTGAVGTPVFIPVECCERELENAHITTWKNEKYYSRLDTNNPVHAIFKYKIPQDGEYYLNLKFKSGTLFVSSGNGTQKQTDVSKTPIFYAGTFCEGDTVTVEFVNSNHDFALYGAEMYFFDEKAFSSGIEKLREGGAAVTYSSSSEIRAKINAGDGGTLYTSIPYDGGWTLTCDGNPVELSKIANFLICAELPEGEHELVFKYSPPGFKTGLIISLSSICAAVFLILIYKKINRKKREDKKMRSGRPDIKIVKKPS